MTSPAREPTRGNADIDATEISQLVSQVSQNDPLGPAEYAQQEGHTLEDVFARRWALQVQLEAERNQGNQGRGNHRGAANVPEPDRSEAQVSPVSPSAVQISQLVSQVSQNDPEGPAEYLNAGHSVSELYARRRQIIEESQRRAERDQENQNSNDGMGR
jgi:hypothetical protein